MESLLAGSRMLGTALDPFLLIRDSVVFKLNESSSISSVKMCPFKSAIFRLDIRRSIDAVEICTFKSARSGPVYIH